MSHPSSRPASIPSLQALLSELRLKHWAARLPEDLEGLKPAEEALWLRKISEWARLELDQRRSSLIASRIKNARFKRLQTVDTFDFTYNKSTRALQTGYLRLHRETSRDRPPSAILTGSTGLGKTHLARALGYAACQHGLSVLFTTAGEIVNSLTHAQKTHVLTAELAKYRRPQVLIVDELGYVSLDTQASNLFFQVISARHDQGLGTIATTNLPFGKWNQVFANDGIAHVIVDRLTAEAEVFYVEGQSYRDYLRKKKQH